MKKGEFIFIGGTGRSGTTILSKILQGNGQIGRLPFELRIHVDPYGLYDLYRNLTIDWDVFRGSVYSSKFSKFYRRITRFSFHSYHNVSLTVESKRYYSEAFEDFFSNLGIKREKRLWIGNSPFTSKVLSMTRFPFARYSYPDFYLTEAISEKTFTRYSEVFVKRILRPHFGDSSYLIEHTPYNFLYFDFLSKVFPKSKFIHIKRNPLDIISSYSGQNWGSAELENNVKQIVSLYKQWGVKSKGFSNYLEISLEDLAYQGEVTKKRLASYLDVCPECLDIQKIESKRLHIDRWKDQKKFFKQLPSLDNLKILCRDLGYEVNF